ncbi:glycoprotein 3-alpha-L-fucosyltransferase A-like [Tubulanus polymorphus]|uniref:glycoprotein 3-alpha-L-fucosyltransferase A-like n=1 Tax=Tubulanus polymorphus TaxID=672921 RepID=UPI003DA322E1
MILAGFIVIVCGLNAHRLRTENEQFRNLRTSKYGSLTTAARKDEARYFTIRNRTAVVVDKNVAKTGVETAENRESNLRRRAARKSGASVEIDTESYLRRHAVNFVKNEGLIPLSDASAIWPEMDHDIRLTAQLQHVPRQAIERANNGKRKLKTILQWGGFKKYSNTFSKPGEKIFLRDDCPVNMCNITDDRSKAGTADVIVIERHVIGTGTPEPTGPRPAHQVRVMFTIESPVHTPLHNKTGYQSSLNWTSNYRRDSTIPIPYGLFVRFNESVRFKIPNRNYASGKTKKVAWFVSNCNEKNDRRKLAKELSKHIDVDVYGMCGPFKCPVNEMERCLDLLDAKYKFYLAFENSNCREYITEKFFENGLSRNVLPIVYGAHKDDYKRVAPPHSFIHVDDFESPKQLAEYLHILDKNDDLYNSYFRWKGTGTVINRHLFWCRLCMLAHAEDPHKGRHISNYDRYWRPPAVCKLNAGYQRWTPPTYGSEWS